MSSASNFLWVALAALLVACGGGGDDDSSQSIPSNVARITGTIVDQLGIPIQGAIVGYPASTGGTLIARTGTNGAFKLDIHQSEFSGVQYPTVYVQKSGYKPLSFFWASLSGGREFSANPISPETMRTLSFNESVPTEGYEVRHLGDNSYGGAVNSQFQKRTTDGLSWVLEVPDFAAKFNAGFRRVTVSWYGKGLQSSMCLNRVSFQQVVRGGFTRYNPGNEVSPGDSARDGSYSAMSRTFNLTGFSANAGLATYVRFDSSLCSPGDADDFEITNVFLTFS